VEVRKRLTLIRVPLRLSGGGSIDEIKGEMGWNAAKIDQGQWLKCPTRALVIISRIEKQK
jgi:hypothetical protein